MFEFHMTDHLHWGSKILGVWGGSGPAITDFWKIYLSFCTVQYVAECRAIYLQKVKELIDAGVTGPEGHLQSRPESVKI